MLDILPLAWYNTRMKDNNETPIGFQAVDAWGDVRETFLTESEANAYVEAQYWLHGKSLKIQEVYA